MVIVAFTTQSSLLDVAASLVSNLTEAEDAEPFFCMLKVFFTNPPESILHGRRKFVKLARHGYRFRKITTYLWQFQKACPVRKCDSSYIPKNLRPNPLTSPHKFDKSKRSP
jgi:hypothetical protein